MTKLQEQRQGKAMFAGTLGFGVGDPKGSFLLVLPLASCSFGVGTQNLPEKGPGCSISLVRHAGGSRDKQQWVPFLLFCAYSFLSALKPQLNQVVYKK